jgi:hypothetical protein
LERIQFLLTSASPYMILPLTRPSRPHEWQWLLYHHCVSIMTMTTTQSQIYHSHALRPHDDTVITIKTKVTITATLTAGTVALSRPRSPSWSSLLPQSLSCYGRKNAQGHSYHLAQYRYHYHHLLPRSIYHNYGHYDGDGISLPMSLSQSFPLSPPL